ncbi:MAG TPA: IS1595 family transposase [Xanthobacteraceae bacterium]|nr:IS1595 family transposase [Xanthobacteraceae bacterium]
MSILAKKYFQDEKSAFTHLESILWPEGPVCPHCGNTDVKRITRLKGDAHRIGVHKCNECRKQFTVKVGTVFESAHIPLHKMLQAVYLMSASKKGISAHQMHRTLEITYKSAWFLCHRIREAMRAGSLAPMGGGGKTVEADETFIGRLEGQPKNAKGGFAHKNVVLTLVERGGSARSFHIGSTSVADIVPIVRDNIDRESHFQTDEARHYMAVGKEFLSHKAVTHMDGQYARPGAHANTVENYYSIFKRGMKGVYQHCKEKHLHRYLSEFDFRYSNRIGLGVSDENRAARAMKGIVGKRLTYRPSVSL